MTDDPMPTWKVQRLLKQIHRENEDDELTEAAERPAVLLLDESVELFDREMEALRLPDGTADVVTDAVAHFRSR